PRPELVEVTGDYTHNSFPSGHTTIAMTVLVAVLLVVPYRWRGWAMLVVMTWAVPIGAYTTTAKWHRFSDTLGADLVALIVGSIAAIILLRAGLVRPTAQRFKLRVVYVVIMAIGGMITLGLGLFIGFSAAAKDLHVPAIEWDLYLTANSLATACSLIAARACWATWRRLQVGISNLPPFAIFISGTFHDYRNSYRKWDQRFRSYLINSWDSWINTRW